MLLFNSFKYFKYFIKGFESYPNLRFRGEYLKSSWNVYPNSSQINHCFFGNNFETEPQFLKNKLKLFYFRFLYYVRIGVQNVFQLQEKRGPVIWLMNPNWKVTVYDLRVTGLTLERERLGTYATQALTITYYSFDHQAWCSNTQSKNLHDE